MTATQDWSDLSLTGLFRIEVETQVAVLNEHLLLLEQQGAVNLDDLDSLMRAAHSIKGAARIVQIESAVKISHALEDFFVTAKQGTLTLGSAHVDVLLQASDFLLRLGANAEANAEAASAGDETASLASECDVNALVLLIEGLVTDSLQAQLQLPDSGATFSETKPSRTELSATDDSKTETKKEEIEQNIESRLEHNVETKTLHNVENKANNTVDEPVTDGSATDEPVIDEPISPTAPPTGASSAARMIRMSADNLNRLMGLAGESLVESNWLQPFAASLLQLKQQQQSVLAVLENLEQKSRLATDGEPLAEVSTAIAGMQTCHDLLSDQLGDLDMFSQRFGQLSDRLYREVIASHMCAFEAGTRGYARLVRDLAKSQGKQVTLEIEGLTTQVDRDILEKLDAPITHLLTNAIAHGIEPPAERAQTSKPPTGTIRIRALHRSGILLISVEDDGAGVDFARLRQKIVHQGMTPADVVDRLSEAELIEFLFLPGFSTASQVDVVAGRGYGLDIARNVVQAVGGALQATSQPGKGTHFQFQLPLTLSVVRSLLFEVAGEPYAMSLARIGRVLRLSPQRLRYSEGKPYFSLEGESNRTDLSVRITDKAAASGNAENISLVSARQVLSLSAQTTIQALAQTTIQAPAQTPAQTPVQTAMPTAEEDIWVVILGEPGSRYGLCVDRLLEERDLVVRPLDARLGKVPNVSSAALTEKGEPILILDVADVLRSAAKLAVSDVGLMSGVTGSLSASSAKTDSQKAGQKGSKSASVQKRVLVVDDSMTVRAMEKKLLQNRGYTVDVAVNGAEGWNAVRMNAYDLVVTDVDMPRMNGIELIQKMRDYAPTRRLPVIVVSYKDRQEDQLAGLNAGANYYLTKSSFHDDGLINAVVDLIGR